MSEPLFKDGPAAQGLEFDSSQMPLLAYDVWAGNRFFWRALPGQEFYINPSSEPVIAIGYNSGNLFAFTDADKLLLPEPEITHEVAKIRVCRPDLASAQRIGRDPENDRDDPDWDGPVWHR